MSGINHFAVWVAGIVQWLIGAGWYTLLGNEWIAGVVKSRDGCDSRWLEEESMTLRRRDT